MEDVKLIQMYINDINSALKGIQTEEVLDLFKRLYDKEQKFAKRLKSTKAGRDVYIKFIRHIHETKGGIKKARPFFRIRENMYLNTVNRAIKTIKPEYMFQTPVNFRFISFAMNNMAPSRSKKNKDLLNPKDPKMQSLFEEIKLIREQIINNHLYLSLNKAKVFTKNFHNPAVEFEDLIQIANESLVSAVDKYVMDDDSSSFHSMAIGIMIANLISYGSFASSVTLGGHAQKKLYKIRKFLHSNPNANVMMMSNVLKIAEEEINDLMSATSYKSFSDPVGNDGDMTFGDVLLETEDEKNTNQEDLVIENNTLEVLSKALETLSTFQRKVLILKGVDIK